MTLVVNGSQQDRATIEGWLREICGPIDVDPNTGAVSVTHPPPYTPYRYITGCNCLHFMVGSGRRVTINPLPGPHADIPGTARPGNPGTPNLKIGMFGGYTLQDTSGLLKPDGSPGTDANGVVGGNADVYIDMSNNNGAGYAPRGKDGQPIPSPLWLILAHELTTGHASHCANGTSGRTHAEMESQAILSEAPHRETHGLRMRAPGEY